MESGSRNEELQRLELEFRALQEQIYERYCQTGKTLLETAYAEQTAINALLEESIRVRKRLAALRREKLCPHCTAINDNDSDYCKRCGKKLQK